MVLSTPFAQIPLDFTIFTKFNEFRWNLVKFNGIL